MKLVMYFGFDKIDAVPLDTQRLTAPGYVGSLKQELMQKHPSPGGSFYAEPRFLIVHSLRQPQ